MYFLGVDFDIRRAPNLPFIEVSAIIAEPNSAKREFFSLLIAKKLVNLVQKYGGILIPPFGDIPIDKNVFFTVQFESNKKTEAFLEVWKN